MAFVYTVDRSGPKVSVVANGEIDAMSAGPFGTELCRLAEPAPTDLIEVDVGGLRFIDSAGVAALNRAYRSTARYGCALVVLNATGLVRRVLELTGAAAHLCPTAGAETYPASG